MSFSVTLTRIPREQLADFPNLVVLCGQTIEADLVPEVLKNYWNLVPTTIKTVERFKPGVTTDDRYRIISSAPAINPANGSLAVPQFALLPTDPKIGLNPTEQFLSADAPNHPVYIGILLGPELSEKTIRSISITPRIPVDGVNFRKEQTSELYNQVPVPSLYQIYGTHDDISTMNHSDPDKLNWESITHPARILAQDWSFVSDTIFTFSENHNAQLKYRGFKFVAYEWDSTRAGVLDKLPGFYRVEFKFVEDDHQVVTLPDFQDPSSGELVAIDFNNFETIEQLPTIEEEKSIKSESGNSEEEISLTNEDVINRTLEVLVSQKFEDIKIRLTTELVKTITTEVNREIDEKINQLNEVSALVQTVLDQTSAAVNGMQSEIDTIIASKFKKSLSALTTKVKKTIGELDLSGYLTAEEFDNRMAERVAELTSIYDQTSATPSFDYSGKFREIENQIVNIQELLDDLTAPDNNATHQDILPPDILASEKLLNEQRALIEESKIQIASTMTGLIDRSIQQANDHFVSVFQDWLSDAKSELLSTDQSKPTGDLAIEKVMEVEQQLTQLAQCVDDMTDDTGVIVIDSATPAKISLNEPVTIKHWYLFGDTHGKRQTIFLPEKAENCRVITIHNCRTDGGEITVVASCLSLVYNRKLLSDRDAVGLTAQAEKLCVVFYNGKWHGELYDGIVHQ